MTQYVIQNQINFPETHFLLYKDEKYPIKFVLFQYSSNYFSQNKKELKKKEKIEISTTENIELTPEIIHSFINFVELKPITLTNENIIPLHYLSNKYDVPSLKEYASNYISDHQYEIAIDLISVYEKDQTADTSKYEDFILSQFTKYIQDENFLTLQFSIIYRLLDKYVTKYLKQENKSKNKDKGKRMKIKTRIFDFFFKCLDKFGKEATVLIEIIDQLKLENEFFERLVQEYSGVVDFKFILTNVYTKYYSLLNGKRKSKQKVRADRNKSEIDDNENKQKVHTNKNKDEFNDFEKDNFDVNDDEMNENFLNSEKDENEKHQMSNYEEVEFEEEEEEEEEECEWEVDEGDEKIKIFSYEKGKEFKGIINYLTKKTGGNIHDNHTIEITSNSISNHPKYLLDFNKNNCYMTQSSEKNAWICFDFKKMKIEISNYSIKSHSFDINSTHIKNWIIEISDDGENWTKIDEHSNYDGLNGHYISKTFSVEPNEFSRFCRFRHTGEYYGYPNWCLAFNSIEFYGRLKEP